MRPPRGGQQLHRRVHCEGPHPVHQGLQEQVAADQGPKSNPGTATPRPPLPLQQEQDHRQGDPDLPVVAGPADDGQHRVQKAAAQMGLDPVQDRQLRRLHGLSPSHLRPVRPAVFVQHHITDLPQGRNGFFRPLRRCAQIRTEFPYFCPRPLTSPGERGRILQNWIAQIEARRPSVPHRQGQAAAGRERVRRRSAEMMPVLSVLGRREYLPDCHKPL